MDDEVARGDRVGDGIDQERHVVVDDADAHPALADLAAEGFEADEGDAGRAALRAGGGEAPRLDPLLLSEVGDLVREGTGDQRMGQGIDIGQVSGAGFRYRTLDIHNVPAPGPAATGRPPVSSPCL